MGAPRAVHHPRVRIRGERFDVLADDLDAAIGELIAAVGGTPGSWERGRPGGWTAGRHAAHVAIALRRTADAFDEAERALRAGTLPPVPGRRGPLQSLVVWMFTGPGFMPAGLRTAPWAVPPEHPDRTATLEALGREAGRHRALGERLGAAGSDRLWIANPFRPRWHYRLPEMVRVQAVHARHHARRIAELAAG